MEINMEQFIKTIIQTKDVNGLMALNEGDLESCLMELVYNHYQDVPFEELNHEQSVLFLCMKLEDACQADTILALAEDGLILRVHEMYDALVEIGAIKTAALIEQFIALLPEDMFTNASIPEWNWFFEKERESKISMIDSEMADYPDEPMRTLYHKYISDKAVAEKIL